MDLQKITNDIPASKTYHDYWLGVLTNALKSVCSGEESVKREPISGGGQQRCQPDLYLPCGCEKLGLKENTIIEFKLKDNPRIVEQARRYIEHFVDEKKRKPSACIVIVQTKLRFNYKAIISRICKSIGETIEIYSIDEFLSKNEELKQVYDKLLSNGLSESSQENWKDIRNSRIEQAKKCFSNYKISLFLGAGVSATMKMPLWDALLKNLLEEEHCNPAMKHITSNDYSSINRACGYSSIVTGRYVTQGLKNIEELIKKIMYEEVNSSRPSKLIKKIGELAKKKQFESIITYNYDDLVESALIKQGLEVESITGPSNVTIGTIPVYHVHGMIPEKRDIATTAVLSEKEYHNIYMNPFHWSNVEQLHALSRNSCLFIGLSMTDPNLRRLCDIAMSITYTSQSGSDDDSNIPDDEVSKHFAFLIRDSFKDGCENCSDCTKNTEHFEVMDRMMRDLGITIIWYEKHDEILDLIDQIIR